MITNNKKLLYILLCFPILFGCATNKSHPEPFLQSDAKESEIFINYTDKEKEETHPINTDEELIEQYIETTINKEVGKKETSELIEEQKTLSTVEPSGKHNFKNVITVYTFSDGKLYSLLLSADTITDLRLEEGETPTGDIMLSDVDNYIIDTALSYENKNEIYHIFIRPINISAPSSMILPTNKRTYYFKLIPSQSSGMVAVKFIYKNNAKKPISSTRLSNIESLNFNYSITGDNTIRPSAVFSDEKSTFIQFSPIFATQSTCPALYLKSKNDLSVVNYSVKGNMYITDFILDKKESFILIQDNKKAEIKRSL